MHFSVRHGQLADRHRQFEAAWTGAAGIEVEHSVARLLLGSVAVAGDHDFESRGFGFQVKLRKIVQNINGDASEFDDFRFGEFAGPRCFVDVAADCGHRRNRSELLENLRLADVSGVNDVIGSPQRGDSFGAKQTVRVGDDADYDGTLSFQLLSCDWNS